MKLAFSVNSKQKKFFKKLSLVCSDIKVYESKKIFTISFKALKYLKKISFKKAINLRVKDFYAKYEINVPKVFLESFYTFLAYYNFFRYFSIFKKKYKSVIVWNGFMFRQAIILEIAKALNKEIIYCEGGYLPNRFVIDKKGINYYNSVPREPEFFKNYTPKPLPKSLIPRELRKGKKIEKNQTPLPQKFIFVPFQVDYDTQILLFSPWVSNMRELFALMEELSQKLGITFVFKEHPSSRKSYEDLKRKQNKHLIFANNYSTQELIQKASMVITINSTVGIESLLFHKKVITLGEAFYNIKGIVKHIKNKNELEKALQEGFEIDFDLVDRFLSYLYYDYLIEGNLKAFNEQSVKMRLCQ